jgi:hypothetical protein
MGAHPLPLAHVPRGERGEAVKKGRELPADRWPLRPSSPYSMSARVAFGSWDGGPFCSSALGGCVAGSVALPCGFPPSQKRTSIGPVHSVERGERFCRHRSPRGRIKVWIDPALQPLPASKRLSCLEGQRGEFWGTGRRRRVCREGYPAAHLVVLACMMEQRWAGCTLQASARWRMAGCCGGLGKLSALSNTNQAMGAFAPPAAADGDGQVALWRKRNGFATLNVGHQRLAWIIRVESSVAGDDGGNT